MQKSPRFRGLFEFWLVERTKGEYKGCAHVLCIWVEYRQKEKEAGWQGWLHECPALRIRRTVAISVSCLHSCTQTPHNASMRAISNSYPPHYPCVTKSSRALCTQHLHPSLTPTSFRAEERKTWGARDAERSCLPSLIRPRRAAFPPELPPTRRV